MNELLTQDDGAELLGPHASLLHDCIIKSWARWQKSPDYATASKRTRASAVYDYIVEEVESAFAETPGVELSRKHGSLLMTIDGTAVIKFKKFRGKRLRTSGIATNSRNLFLRQAGVLDGMVVTHLVVGYLLDKLETEPEKIAVTAPLGKGNLWALDLGADFGQEDGITAPLPFVSEDPHVVGTTIRSTKVVARDDAVNEE